VAPHLKKLQFVDISISLRDERLLGPLALTVSPGRIVTVMGPSGSGKSTLLAFACGTLDPAFTTTGQVILNGVDVTHLPPEKRRMGILFQDDLLFPHLSVGENLAFGLPRGLLADERRARVDAALADADLKTFAERDPATLSGGQRARIALLRTLAAEPRALLLDEPFSKLDARLRERFRRFVFQHATEQSLPTLLVTHDPADAAAAGGPVIEIGPVLEDEISNGEAKHKSRQNLGGLAPAVE
jgi:putative thiamine transport system ATP-binding protein